MQQGFLEMIRCLHDLAEACADHIEFLKRQAILRNIGCLFLNARNKIKHERSEVFDFCRAFNEKIGEHEVRMLRSSMIFEWSEEQNQARAKRAFILTRVYIKEEFL